MNIKLSSLFFKWAFIISIGTYFIVNADFCQPKKLTKGQLKQKIAEHYELSLRQTSKVAEVNALLQQELHEHIAKLLNDDPNSVFKTYTVGELNNYYEKLKNITAENDIQIGRLMGSLNGLKSNFGSPKLNDNKSKNS